MATHHRCVNEFEVRPCVSCLLIGSSMGRTTRLLAFKIKATLHQVKNFDVFKVDMDKGLIKSRFILLVYQHYSSLSSMLIKLIDDTDAFEVQV